MEFIVKKQKYDVKKLEVRVNQREKQHPILYYGDIPVAVFRNGSLVLLFLEDLEQEKTLLEYGVKLSDKLALTTIKVI